MALQNEADIWEDTGHLKEEYLYEVLEKCNYSTKTIENKIYQYRKFKEVYTNLSEWFDEKIELRIGDKVKKDLNYRNRSYIFLLAIMGLEIDYKYLCSISGTDGYVRLLSYLNIDIGFEELRMKSIELGYSEFSSGTTLKWSLVRILMHTGKSHYSQIKIDDINKFRDYASVCYKDVHLNSELDKNDNLQNVIDRFTGSTYQLQLVLYVLGVVKEEPKRVHSRQRKIDRDLSHISSKEISDVVIRYLNQCKLVKESGTIQNSFTAINKFILWLQDKHPEVVNLKLLSRNIIEEYFKELKEKGTSKFGKPYTPNALLGYISPVKVFLDEALAWGYDDVPTRKLIFNYDLPKRPKSKPRYIKESDLNILMDSVAKLECPYQKNAIILLRWTGARREEIHRLDINALDYYNDGTPKLLIPIGKTNSSRWVPINEEAKKAYKELLEIRKNAGNLKGLIDRKTKKATDYLFMKRNQMISTSYLFQDGLMYACEDAGLLDDSGKAKYTSHQFRHTIGTTMANKGASVPTIMKMLGHHSPDMTLVYSTIFDETVKDEYQKTVDTNKEVIAGGLYAKSLKNNELKKEEVDWIKANFHKTYLMIGHCFHHTREAMCDFADACFFCSKYVTTEQHIPILKNKYEVENKLIQDAEERNWEKEIIRHKRVADRVKEILNELGVDL
ncbi:MAG: tyrosine-type recombinase/integrase [Romboutsia sp.]|uniref:tyrosine-type recombinase/integrase n=1 Tax=Romboutsia sp. TaxID=1965302 RepID=UPI003F3F7115